MRVPQQRVSFNDGDIEPKKAALAAYNAMSDKAPGDEFAYVNALAASTEDNVRAAIMEACK